MGTMFTASLAPVTHVETAAAPSRPGFFKRLLTALIESRERAAEREIERYIAAHGGVMTDNIERDISRTFGKTAGGGF